jgi:hypothetical protein
MKLLFQNKESIEDRFFRFIIDVCDLSLLQNLIHDIRGVCYSIHLLIIEWLCRRLPERVWRNYIYEGIFVIETFLEKSERENKSMKSIYKMIGYIRICFQNNTQLSGIDNRFSIDSLFRAGLLIYYFFYNSDADIE